MAHLKGTTPPTGTMLLDLPPELVQLVLLNCTTPAFVQAAWTCRTLYEIALGCRESLVHHLQRTPGPSLDTSSLSTNRLFSLLKSRASKQLYGSQFNAGCITFSLGARLSNLTAWSLVSHADRTLVFTTVCDQSAVQVFEVDDEQLLPVSQAKLPWDQLGSLETLKTAFNGVNEIYILFRFTPSVDEHHLDSDPLFVKQAKELDHDGFLCLTCHSLEDPSSPVRITTLPDHEDFQPSALAVANDGSFAIAWCHRMLPDHTVVHYTVNKGSEYEISANLVGKFDKILFNRGTTKGAMVGSTTPIDRDQDSLIRLADCDGGMTIRGAR